MLEVHFCGAWFNPFFFGFFWVWMTFKKAEMKKTLRNGLSFSEQTPLTTNVWILQFSWGWGWHCTSLKKKNSSGLNIYLYFYLDFRSLLMEKLWNLGVSQLMLEDGMCRSA